MTPPAGTAASRSIVVEEILPHAPDAVWTTLTTAESIAHWLMPNDFAPSVGKLFTFRTRPMGDWDGVVLCEVLEIEPEARLVYGWKGGSAGNGKYGGVLDSVVTWTLAPAETGTRLRLEHAGFRSPENDAAFDAMSAGWGRIMQGIGRAAGEL